jgi:hypothetical protein
MAIGDNARVVGNVQQGHARTMWARPSTQRDDWAGDRLGTDFPVPASHRNDPTATGKCRNSNLNREGFLGDSELLTSKVKSGEGTLLSLNHLALDPVDLEFSLKEGLVVLCQLAQGLSLLCGFCPPDQVRGRLYSHVCDPASFRRWSPSTLAFGSFF